MSGSRHYLPPREPGGSPDLDPGGVVKGLAVVLGCLLLVVALGVLGVGGCKEFNRYQKRADAKNRTQIVKQEIKTAEQQAEVVHAQNAAVQAKADQRVIEAKGIRAAQDEISATLTPLYVQHEAIQAQLKSPSEKVYIPSGASGVPLVADVSGDRVGGGK